MSSSGVGALPILRKWDAEKPWVYVAAMFGEFEKHELWARVVEVSDDEVFFAGKSATVSLPLSGTDITYFDPREAATTELRERFKQFNSCLMIRSSKVLAFLFRGEPNGK
jgi:hypothetical protein